MHNSLLQMKHVGYIYCTERLVLENKLEQWADCFELVGLSRAALDCYINGYGHQVNSSSQHQREQEKFKQI